MRDMIGNVIHALVFPIEITRAEIFRDGGTVGIALKDAAGAEVEFCLYDSIRRQTREQLYWGAFYPGNNSGQLVARGSTAEASIIAFLTRIINQWYSEAEQKAQNRSRAVLNRLQLFSKLFSGILKSFLENL